MSHIATMAARMDKFLVLLDEERELFASTGNLEEDYKTVTAIIEINGGYWAGSEYKYFLDADFNLIDVQKRRFGQ